ncbi:DUF2442 domain-containing protein [Allofrancisella guangzhouensis]|uniref:DUF2442 domain-containing protein n=1 Tax=Allofrancisella guangzhouensis TaxID=594679 RepID=UPI0019032FD2|nr:DUF2442 domain-containing protein [Allofrancisella guangzhouensis]MBK2044854.1 DUF2442 domain-containing protein [Allofrancisella guangzhouensis]MBK2045000.1 DUF2442 domain-containing protein [Allofrancisella guangzhouensis]
MWKDPINVQVTSKNTLEVLFEDGLKGQIIFYPSRFRGVFKSLEDENEFRRVFIDREIGTVTWENGLDLAPDVMYEQISKKGQWILE